MLLKTILSMFFFLVTTNAYPIGGAGPMDKAKQVKGAKNERPPFMDDVGITERLGEQVSLDLPFFDEDGNEVKLGKYFNKDVPVFLMLIYYDCPTLCSTHMNTVVTTLKNFEWQIGKNYEFVVVSFDPNEKPKLAKKKKQNYLRMYGKPVAENKWHFLTGNQASINTLTTQMGFRYAWNPNEKQWAHAAASYVLTPEGKISYYHYGLNIVPKVFRLSLVEASDNKIGTVMDRLLLFCLQYDPNKKTYSFYAYNLMRLGGVLMIIFLVVFFYRFWKSERLKEQA